MGWNDPDKGGKDPWNDKKNPPDLEEAIKRFHEKLKKTFFGSSQTPANKPASSPKGIGLVLSLFAFLVFMLWVLSGIFIVHQAEQAVILRFGKYVETVGPGPHWIPRFIESRVVANVERVSDYSYSAQMLTQDTNLVSVSVAVKYRIGDLKSYLFNVADPEESLKQATSSALRQVVGTTTLEQIITAGQEAWGMRVQDTLIKILDSYQTGILVKNVDPQSARAPENVQDAFDDAIKAREDEKRFKAQALAYEARVLPIAKGRADRIREEAKAFAQQVVLRARGEVAEFLALLPAYLQSPVVTAERMYLDSMQKVLSKSATIIVDGKAGNLMYLPLDKLNASVPMSPLQDRGQAEAKAPSLLSTSEDTYLDRLDVRQTIRQGRDS